MADITQRDRAAAIGILEEHLTALDAFYAANRPWLSWRFVVEVNYERDRIVRAIDCFTREPGTEEKARKESHEA